MSLNMRYMLIDMDFCLFKGYFHKILCESRLVRIYMDKFVLSFAVTSTDIFLEITC